MHVCKCDDYLHYSNYANAMSSTAVQLQVLLLETEPPPPLRGLRTQQDTPVLVLLGHFNHGKTTLLDALLGPDSCIVQGEAAGITQEIRARTVSLCTSSAEPSSGEFTAACLCFCIREVAKLIALWCFSRCALCTTQELHASHM